METINQTTTYTNRGTNRRAAINGLAVVGFIALIIIGITLAIYSARFVPAAVSRIASATVLLSQGKKEDGPALSAVTATTSIPFITEASSTPATTTIAIAPAPSKASGTSGVSAGAQTTHYYGNVPASHTLYGLPDLSVRLIDVGYLTNGSNDSFVASHVVSNGNNVALKFDISNDGTNASGQYYFTVELPTGNSYIFSSDAQDSLLPGEHVQYVISFDKASAAVDEKITVSVDQKHYVVESNEVNNIATAFVTVK